MRWTDDTQMSIDIMESLVQLGRVEPDDLARRFAASYRWSRGYGPATARVLKRIARGQKWEIANTAVYAEGSFGNGAAMRVPMLAMFYAGRPHELDDAVRRSAVVTHAHPLAIEGAIVIAHATAIAAQDGSTTELLDAASARCVHPLMIDRLALARRWLADGRPAHPTEIASKLGRGIASADSCITALYLAAHFRERDYMDLQRVVSQIGGDADTIGAMAGAIWGAARGVPAVPPHVLARLEQHGRLVHLADELFARAANPSERR